MASFWVGYILNCYSNRSNKDVMICVIYKSNGEGTSQPASRPAMFQQEHCMTNAIHSQTAQIQPAGWLVTDLTWCHWWYLSVVTTQAWFFSLFLGLWKKVSHIWNWFVWILCLFQLLPCMGTPTYQKMTCSRAEYKKRKPSLWVALECVVCLIQDCCEGSYERA